MSTQSTSSIVSRLAVAASAAALSLSATAETRYWTVTSGESAQFGDTASWDPVPDSMSDVGGDTFIINKGTNNVALLASSDDITVDKLFLGEGANGSGRLDIPAGKLTSTHDVSVGYSNCGGTENFLNISGGQFITKSGSAAPLRLGVSGKGTLQMTSGYFKSDHFYIGCGGEGVFDISGGNAEISGEWHIGKNSVGYVHVSGDANVRNNYAMYFGKDGGGDGCLTIDGGSVFSNYSINFNGGNAVINLNRGGTLSVMEFTGSGNGLFNWNGGVLTHNGVSYNYDILGAGSIQNVEVKVGVYGAIYQSKDAGSTQDKISHALSGIGALVKRGDGTLTVTGALDLKGGIKVEGGTLVVNNITRTRFRELSVADGATLDLGGASVVVAKYLVGGDDMPAGTYSAHGGTIRVLTSEENTAALAKWANALGDGDVTNPLNWNAENANGEDVFSAPSTDTPICVPYAADSTAFSGFSHITKMIDKNTRVEWYTTPDIVKEAAAWYDPSDIATLNFAGEKVSGIINKGTVGSALDLGLRSESRGGAVVTDTAFNGAYSLYFNNASGYRSNGFFPDSLPASGPRTLFVLVHGSSVGFLSVAQANDNEEGRSLLLADGSQGKAYQVGCKDSGSWSKGKANYLYAYDKACVISGRTMPIEGGTNEVKSCVLDAEGNTNGESKNFYMPSDGVGLQFKSYYGTFDVVYWSSDTSGYQGEALIFTKALTDAEMDEVNAYLKTKWLLAAEPVMTDVDHLVVDATVNLSGGTATFATLSGSGSFVNGTVVLTGELIVTVNADGSVNAPSFDKLVLGNGASLVVKGARHLKSSAMIQLVTFNSLQGTFASAVGEGGVLLKVVYANNIEACRAPGMRVHIR